MVTEVEAPIGRVALRSRRIPRGVLIPIISVAVGLLLWEAVAREEGPDSDFTTVIKPLERTAGVTVGPSRA